MSEPEHLAADVRAIREAFAGIMGRVVARLDGSSVRTLQLVTTGKLGLLPIHAALPGAMSREQAVEAVGFAPSAMLLDALRTADRDKAGQKATLAGVANPLPHAVPLPFAPFELARITKRFPEGAWCKVENFGVTREAVLSLLARGPDEDGMSYVHMACHGQYDIAQPLDSELSLAGGKGLKLVELLDRDLLVRTRLVTLSACQTAVMDVNDVPDEMGSLATGFLAAGATGVVATLWAVDDLACALLFDRFYGELLRSDGTRAMDPAVALARAQQWLRTVTALALEGLFNDASHAFEAEHGKAHPLLARAARHFGARPGDEACFGDAVYWAGFIHVGV
jgi:CHAT domain-containing protein